MIVTVTLNPCVDNTFWTEDRDDSVCGTEREAGGKGINVARILNHLGVPCKAVAPAGGENGALFAQLCKSEGVPLALVPIAGETRAVDTYVRKRDFRQRVIVHRPPRMSDAECASLFETVVSLLPEADAVAVCGSACCEEAALTGRRLICAAKEAGVTAVLDSNGFALTACASAGPDLIKPNQNELAQLTGAPVGDGEEDEACQMLLDRGIGSVLLSRGAEGAALYRPGKGPLRVPAPRVETVNPVGSGDCFLAAWLHARHRQVPDETALRWACAAGAANAAVFPAARITKRDIERQAGFTL